MSFWGVYSGTNVRVSHYVHNNIDAVGMLTKSGTESVSHYVTTDLVWQKQSLSLLFLCLTQFLLIVAVPDTIQGRVDIPPVYNIAKSTRQNKPRWGRRIGI